MLRRAVQDRACSITLTGLILFGMAGGAQAAPLLYTFEYDPIAGIRCCLNYVFESRFCRQRWRHADVRQRPDQWVCTGNSHAVRKCVRHADCRPYALWGRARP